MKGILFKPDMIKAIIENRKCQTRRVIKPQPTNMQDARRMASVLSDARYKKDEVVYVKETWQYAGTVFNTSIKYKIDNKIKRLTPKQAGSCSIDGKWKSPLFMPESASRIRIQITDIKSPERFNQISKEDAIAEGFYSIQEFLDYIIKIHKPKNIDGFLNQWCFPYKFRKVNNG
jgi:hypothetical protein